MIKRFLQRYRACLLSDKFDEICFEDREDYFEKQRKNVQKYSSDSDDVDDIIRIILSAVSSPYALGLYEAFSRNDLALLHDVLYQACRHSVFDTMGMPSTKDHCTHYPFVFRSLAANDKEIFEILFPKALGASQNGSKIQTTIINLFIALYYGDSSLAQNTVAIARELIHTSRITRCEQALIEYLLALYDRDMNKASLCLETFTCLLGRQRYSNNLLRLFAMQSHGLYAFGAWVLEPHVFAQLQKPTHHSFIQELAQFQHSRNFTPGRLFLHFDGALKAMNTFLQLPLPATTLCVNTFLKKNVIDANSFQAIIKARAKEILTC